MKKLPLILLTALAATAATLPPTGPDLADAAQRQDVASLRALIKQHAPVNTAQPDGTTALHWAAHWNDTDSVKLLLTAGADAKATNRYGATPISEAASLGNAAVMDALLKAGADPNTRVTSDGETVLMTTARTGNVDAVRSLLDHGADVNATESFRNQTALMWAAAERHPQIVKLLLAKGADWKVISKYRETKLPKLSAASSITPFSRGGFTALHFTAREGDIETAKIMLDAGVDINVADIDNTSPIIVAIMNKQYTFAKFLLDRGADVNMTDVKGRAALYAAVDMRNEDWSSFPNRKLEDKYPSLDLIKGILAKGAKVDAKLTRPLPGRSGMDSGDTTLDEGTTPFMRAARSGDATTMRLLLEAGADLDTDHQRRHERAAVRRWRRLSRQKHEGHRSRSARRHEGLSRSRYRYQPRELQRRNRVHGAASRGADTLVKYLVEHGAKLDSKTKRGFTPLDVALGKDQFALPVPHDSTVALIRSLGGPEGGH